MLVAVTGWLGFLVYPRLGLPAATGATLLGLAAVAGIASFFSPCSFPLLATILSREVGEGAPDGRPRVASALRFALALSAGAASFLVLLGLAIAAGSGGLFGGVTFGSAAGRAARAVVGITIVGLGLIQAGIVHVGAFHAAGVLVRPLQRRQAALRRSDATAGFVLFGFGYVLAGFG